MQWLIDIIKEWADAKFVQIPAYVSRGDPVGLDFDITDLTLDGALHELDLSGIVPEGAVAVQIIWYFVANVANTCMWLYPSDTVNFQLALGVTSQVANIEINSDGFVRMAPDRKLKYLQTSPPIISVGITVKGWLK